MQSLETKSRCFGNKPGQDFYAHYHDKEWGIPVHDDRLLFEMLCLEGAQAGLSWETILKRREGYCQVFYNFDANKIVKMTDQELNQLCQDPRIIRHRLKIYSIRQNAQVFLEICQEFGSFDAYIWGFVEHNPISNHWKSFKEVPVKTAQSDALSRDLKKRGMSFVGSTIIYAFMQAVGLVNDHLTSCWCYQHNKKEAGLNPTAQKNP
ncbi:MAG: DNA-3-methyladenine glycosylase I [Verrucomicrobia bacterium]|nr:DNA-3-methyladenine glycosylase I [Verrucomicrobiota bacterium]MBS0647093.1 DNA-3-methyladenine glycosylase I [Verrucomicrobiota bacterium]